MAAISNTQASRKPGFLTRMGMSARRWASSFTAPSKQITEADAFNYGAGMTTVAALLGSGSRGARARQIIYEKWSLMEGDPIISTALMLLVTSALGGHETNGDLVFVEKTTETKHDKRLSRIVDEIAADLIPLFNRVAFQVAYAGAAFGDAYARIYTNSDGVIDLNIDETLRPPLVQPFERGSRTVGFAVYLGERNFERLDVSQVARLKMPRVQWVPQYGIVEKAVRLHLTEDDIDRLPILPSMVGGSLLYSAEIPYDNLAASLLGLVGQRWLDSIDEQLVTVNMESMNREQQESVNQSVKDMLLRSKSYAEQAVKTGRPFLERIRHVIPVFSEKQVVQIGPGNGTGRTATISVEDVMLHARLLSGALGVDLSMLGFADQLSGGLGEGGFFRVSAQAAERARVIRVALSEFFNHVIDIHTMRRYGMVFDASERPWEINFFGSISALEAEKQRTRSDAMNAGMLLAQAMQAFKELGASKNVMEEFLTKTMLLDQDQAKLYATIVDKPKQPASDDGGGGFGADMDAGFDEDEDGDDLGALDSAAPAGLGPVFTEYKNDPEGAIKRLMREKTGDARAVWTRPDIGAIDLVWGGERFGISKISRKHPAGLKKLPWLLKHGRLVRLDGNAKVYLVDDKAPMHVTVISLEYFGKQKTWVVTSYDDENEKFKKLIASVNPNQLDSAGGNVANANSNFSKDAAGALKQVVFTGSLKTMNSGALDSAGEVILSADQRTAPIVELPTIKKAPIGGSKRLDTEALVSAPMEVLDAGRRAASIVNRPAQIPARPKRRRKRK